MSKKSIKIVTMILIVLTICSISFNVFALIPLEVKADGADASVKGVDTIGNNIVKILQTAGVVLSVIILIVIGIKYMMGSAEEKAEYKKTLMPYVIGAGLIFAASALAQVVYNFFTNWTITQ